MVSWSAFALAALFSLMFSIFPSSPPLLLLPDLASLSALGCSGFPDCHITVNLPKAQRVSVSDQQCPRCSSNLGSAVFCLNFEFLPDASPDLLQLPSPVCVAGCDSAFNEAAKSTSRTSGGGGGGGGGSSGFSGSNSFSAGGGSGFGFSRQSDFGGSGSSRSSFSNSHSPRGFGGGTGSAGGGFSTFRTAPSLPFSSGRSSSSSRSRSRSRGVEDDQGNPVWNIDVDKDTTGGDDFDAADGDDCGSGGGHGLCHILFLSFLSFIDCALLHTLVLGRGFSRRGGGRGHGRSRGRRGRGRGRGRGRRGGSSSTSDNACFNCGQTGHWSKDCPVRNG